MLRVLTMAAMAACAAAAEVPATDEERGLRETYERLMAREGISLGGEFRSEFLNSGLSGDAISPRHRSAEDVAYTAVDFDLRARPNSSTQGRLVMRLHQDWRNFFSEIRNPIYSRWISLDGSAGDVFYYSAGDFRRSYSPLTLHAPEVRPLYEPEIFARDRVMAMEEEFLGGNDRVMQGVDLNLEGRLAPAFESLRLGAFGTRLRNVQVHIPNGQKATLPIELSPVEKYAAGTNMDLAFAHGFSAGVTALAIFDAKSTFRESLGVDIDTLAQSTAVYAGRGALSVARLLGLSDWKVGLSAEYALSRDEDPFMTPDSVREADTLRHFGRFHDRTVTGSALIARLESGYEGSESYGIGLDLGFTHNSADFRNELAQSPTFLGSRVMNVENDTAWASHAGSGGSRAFTPQYSTFDALYRHVFKFTSGPSSDAWSAVPFSKNSYTSTILTQEEMKRVGAYGLDPALQLLMPFGAATPNRSGLEAELTAVFLERRVEAKLLVARLEELEAAGEGGGNLPPKAKFSRRGAGAKVGLHSFFQWSRPLEFTAGFVRSQAHDLAVTLPSDSAAAVRAAGFTSDFLNAGGYYGFGKRFALLGGYQRIANNLEAGSVQARQIQRHLSVGLEYKVSEAAYALARAGQVKVEYPEGGGKSFEQLHMHLSLRIGF